MAKRSKSIRTKLVLPLIIIMSIQAVLFLALVLFGGVFKNLKTNAIDILQEKTENRRLYLEKEMVHRWINVIADTDVITDEIQQVLDSNGKNSEDIKKDPELNRRITETVTQQLMDLRHRGYATGIFIVLDGPAALKQQEILRSVSYTHLDVYKRQTLYPVLRRLQKEACLEVYDLAIDGRNRRYYNITEKGRVQRNLYKGEWGSYSQKKMCIRDRLIAVFVSLFSIIIAYPAAYTLARMKFRGKKFFSRAVLFTYLMPTSVLYIPLYIFVSKLGLTNTIWGLMVIYPTFTLPYVAWILMPHIASIPQALEEAAYVDITPGRARGKMILYIVWNRVQPSI